MQTDRVIVSGGLVLAHGDTAARAADIVLEGDIIVAIVLPGSADAPQRIDATGRLIIPGLVNAHTHGHGGLAKGIGDRWSLELLLNGGPWINGGRTGDDRYLSTLLTAIEMIRKGCTACYDLSAMLPAPSVEALHDVARAYCDVGMRAVIAPMIADRTFYQAIPGLLDAFPPELRPVAEAMRSASAETILAPIREAARAWSYPADRIRLGIAPTIPLHCSDNFLRGCRDLANEFGLPVQTHLAESAVQRAAALKQYGSTLTAHLDRMGLLGPSFSGAHAIWIDDAEIELIARHGG
jgi:5-methylthioadenosine/S-adenosylhomocysteine deaminase